MPETIQPHILVVDDDPQIRELLQEYLTENTLRVSVTSTGEQMAAILDSEAIDLVILDLRLAGEDGMAIARTLRDKSAIPIIMVTGIRDEADRIMGLELGADDYLTKPFSPRELLARIRTVLRRTKGQALTEARQREVRAYRFVDFELNLRTRRLTKRAQGVELTNGEFTARGEPRVRQRGLRPFHRRPSVASAAQNRDRPIAAAVHRDRAWRGLLIQLAGGNPLLIACCCRPSPGSAVSDSQVTTPKRLDFTRNRSAGCGNPP
jgi:DNA-binding response OmpR family regulator